MALARTQGTRADVAATILNIQQFSVHDGPGIRTTVFLKGCPLHCLWCSNPESQNGYPELAHQDRLCDKCGRCVDVCDVGAIHVTESGVAVDRTKCSECLACTAACTRGALHVYGERRTAEDVLSVVKRDRPYYEPSGGVTLSGGEPLVAAEFVAELFKRCRHEGIHTAVETSGYVDASRLQCVLPWTDLVMLDLKLMDPDSHREWTGRTNGVIVENAQRIISSSASLVIRFPVIPGVNNKDANLEATIGFLLKMGRRLSGLSCCHITEPERASTRCSTGLMLLGEHKA